MRTLKQIRILLIEDRQEQRELLQECLQLDGHNVDTAADGEKAVAQLRKANYDLIITDCVMSDMSGLDVAEMAKKMDSEIPVILITGYGDSLDPDDKRVDKLDLMLSKPVGMHDLRKAIRRVMG